jgi:hypothetical protein
MCGPRTPNKIKCFKAVVGFNGEVFEQVEIDYPAKNDGGEVLESGRVYGCCRYYGISSHNKLNALYLALSEMIKDHKEPLHGPPTLPAFNDGDKLFNAKGEHVSTVKKAPEDDKPRLVVVAKEHTGDFNVTVQKLDPAGLSVFQKIMKRHKDAISAVAGGLSDHIPGDVGRSGGYERHFWLPTVVRSAREGFEIEIAEDHADGFTISFEGRAAIEGMTVEDLRLLAEMATAVADKAESAG